MSLVTIDDRGRIVIPGKIRRKLGIRAGDVFIILNVKEDLIVLKKIDVKKLLSEIAKELAKSGPDIEEVERQLEEEANKLVREKLQDR